MVRYINAEHYLRGTKLQESCTWQTAQHTRMQNKSIFLCGAEDRSLFARRISSHDHDKMKSPFSRLPPPTYVAVRRDAIFAQLPTIWRTCGRKMYGKCLSRGCMYNTYTNERERRLINLSGTKRDVSRCHVRELVLFTGDLNSNARSCVDVYFCETFRLELSARDETIRDSTCAFLEQSTSLNIRRVPFYTSDYSYICM